MSLDLREAEYLADRRRVSIFIVYLIPPLCGFMFATDWLRTVAAGTTGTTIITLPIIVVMMLILIRPMRLLALPWAAYGITRAKWRQSMGDGLLLATPTVLVITALEYRTGEPIFDIPDIRHFVVFNLAYVLVVVPLQELFVRGLLQGLLERFIISEHRTLLAILISNLIFGCFHLYLSVAAAVATVVLGVLLGAIYSRTRNLLGVCIAHAIIGTWALSVVRLGV